MHDMESLLRRHTLQAPAEALRERVLHEPTLRPSEWARLWQTVQWSTVTLIVIYSWAHWYEFGSESMRRGLRTTPYAIEEARVTRQVAEAMEGVAEAELQRYFVSMQMDAFVRPFSELAPKGHPAASRLQSSTEFTLPSSWLWARIEDTEGNRL